MWNARSYKASVPGFLKEELDKRLVNSIDHTKDTSQIIRISFTTDCLVSLQISNHKTLALVDTGSSVNCISQTTLTKAGLKHIIPRHDARRKFRTASDNAMECYGSVQLSFRMNNRKYTDTFFVFPHLSQDVIIGRPFLHRNKATLNFNNNQMTILKGTDLLTTARVRIGPDETLMIKTKSKTRTPTGLHGYIGGHRRRNGVQVHDCIATACDDRIAILITNKSTQNVTIKKGHKIASFKPITASQQAQMDYHTQQDAESTIPPHGRSNTRQANRTAGNSPTTTNSHPDISAAWPDYYAKDYLTAEENSAWRKDTWDVNSLTQERENARCRDKQRKTCDKQKQIEEYLAGEYDIQLDDCDREIRSDIATAIYDNREAFTDKSGRIGFNDWCPLKIQLQPGTKPFAKQPYRMPPDTREQLQKQISKLLENGILLEENSNWAAPVIPIKKQAPRARRHMRDKNSVPEIRLCVDFRYLNAHTLAEQTHIVNSRELMDDISMVKPRYFTTLDLSLGFFQQALDPESRQYTGFMFNRRSYTFRTVPQGLSQSPHAFSSLMHMVLAKVNEPKHVFSYLDDVIIVSREKEHHIQLLTKVLKAFKDANLTLCGRKSKFGREKVTFLGYDLSEKGMTVPLKHREAIASWPIPRNARAVKSFTGCVQYFRHFVPNRGKLLKPLLDLTKKDQPFKWTETHQQSFDALKQILGSEPLLRHPDFNKRFTVYSDASAVAIGGALVQTCDKTGLEYPVAFYGRSTNAQESKWSTTDLEALALISCVREWEVYLSGNEFTVVTDHKALTHIFKGHSKISPKLARYAMYLSEFRYQIEHLKGTSNLIADGLSRRLYGQQETDTDAEMAKYPRDIGITAVTRARAAKEREETQKSREEVKDTHRTENTTTRTKRIPDAEKLADNAENESGVQQTTTRPKRIPDAAKLADNAENEPGVQQATENADQITDFPSAEQLKAAQQGDTFCNDIRVLLEQNELPIDRVRRERCLKRENDFCIKEDGVLYQIWQPLVGREYIKYRALIPESLQKAYIQGAHYSNGSSHLGTDRLIAMLRERVIFKGMYQKCADFVSKCEVC